MIVGIGIDLVESGRFLDWSAFKKQRIFTKKELEYADADNANAEKHLANFWAAREACLKALGTGFGDDIAFSDISVVHDDNGHPEIMIMFRRPNRRMKRGAILVCMTAGNIV